CRRGEWYVTGDRARRDEDGYLWFVGRADDVIISAGYRIGPFEVESALLEHPAVVESAVVASPDPVRGEIVKAFVVLRPGHAPGEALVGELQEHVKRVTAPYKYPCALRIPTTRCSVRPACWPGHCDAVDARRSSSRRTGPQTAAASAPCGSPRRASPRPAVRWDASDSGRAMSPSSATRTAASPPRGASAGRLRVAMWAMSPRPGWWTRCTLRSARSSPTRSSCRCPSTGIP